MCALGTFPKRLRCNQPMDDTQAGSYAMSKRPGRRLRTTRQSPQPIVARHMVQGVPDNSPGAVESSYLTGPVIARGAPIASGKAGSRSAINGSAMTEIADQVRQIISDHFKARNIDASRVVLGAHLVGDLGADSLDLVEIVFALEDQFGREIGEEETERLVTVGDVIALIEYRVMKPTSQSTRHSPTL
jgi:acyl carrier protein